MPNFKVVYCGSNEVPVGLITPILDEIGAELSAYRGPVHRIAGQTLGIVGLGHVGQQVAPRAQGLGLRVQATDPYLAPEVAARLGVALVSLDELIRGSDFVSLHAPLYSGTRRMIDAERLRQFKPGAFLINCARGQLVDTEALMEALRSAHIAGAALGV